MGIGGFYFREWKLFHFVDDCLEGGGVVEGKVGEDFAVDLDASLVDESHELGVGEVLGACCGVDTLDPECAEVAFFVFAVAVGVCKAFFPGVFGYCPDVFAAAVVTAGEFQDFLTTGARGHVVD